MSKALVVFQKEWLELRLQRGLLLATPIRTSQLLVGKSLSALVPTVVLTLACALLFVAGIALWAVTPRVASVVITPGWVAVLAVDMPLLALIGIALIVIVSSRVNDPRTAQQVSAVLIVPVLGLLFGQLSGVLVLNLPFALLGALELQRNTSSTQKPTFKPRDTSRPDESRKR